MAKSKNSEKILTYLAALPTPHEMAKFIYDECITVEYSIRFVGIAYHAFYAVLSHDRNIAYVNDRALTIAYLKITHHHKEWQEFKVLCNHYKIDLDTAIEDMEREDIEIMMYGSKDEIQFSITSSSGIRRDKISMIEGIADKIDRKYIGTS